MTSLATLGPLTGCVLALAYLACACGQVVHGFLRRARLKPGGRAAAVAHEGALLAHLVLMCAFAAASAAGAGAAQALGPLLWANVAVALVAAHAALTGPGEDELEPLEDPAWTPAVEALACLVCTPAAAGVLGGAWAVAVAIDAAFLAFRTTLCLAADARSRRRAVSVLSLAEALKLFPEGIIYADAAGRTLAANDAMRHCLAALGLPTDFAHVDELWTLLNEKAVGDRAVRVAQDLGHEPGAWVFLRISAAEVRLFAFEGDDFGAARRYPSARAFTESSVRTASAGTLLGSEPRIRIIAFDVTREVELLEQIEAANEELAASQVELARSLDAVRESAENEAMLRMRGRVHDVIGQRLSMLHRALEDDVSDEKLDQLKPLINGILGDLAAEEEVDPRDSLAATVDAFACAGVTVDFHGQLPADRERARVFADCVREAATNAVKHARAAHVVAESSDTSLRVSNDGAMPALPLREGTGLASMRRMAESAGASFSVDALEPPFAIRLEFPRPAAG